MRVLLGCSMGGTGHLTPLVPVARAARQGHEVLLVVPPALAEAAAATGLPTRLGDDPPRKVVEEVWRRVAAGPPEAVAGLIDRELFAGHATEAMLPAVRAAVGEWGPDLVVRDPCEYASAVAAVEAGVAQAQVAISLAALESGVLEAVSPIVSAHAAGVGDAIRAAPYLSRFPASLDPSPFPRTVRFGEPAPPAAPLPDWWPGDRRPLVYVTFGTVTGHLPVAGDAYRTALAAAAGLDNRVLLTVGRAFDPAELGRPPAHVRVEAWVPQADVLAEAAVVVGHGGSGTTFGALAAGVPQVVVPLFADQPRNAALVEAAGAGVAVAGEGSAVRRLGPGDAGPIRAAVQQVLGEPSYREAAARVGAEMAAAPTVDEVVAGLLAAAGKGGPAAAGPAP